MYSIYTKIQHVHYIYIYIYIVYIYIYSYIYTLYIYIYIVYIYIYTICLSSKPGGAAPAPLDGGANKGGDTGTDRGRR